MSSSQTEKDETLYMTVIVGALQTPCLFCIWYPCVVKWAFSRLWDGLKLP